MKVTAVIKELQKLKKRYGNLPVNGVGMFGDKPMQNIMVYDSDGNTPRDGSKSFEIFLH